MRDHDFEALNCSVSWCSWVHPSLRNWNGLPRQDPIDEGRAFAI